MTKHMIFVEEKQTQSSLYKQNTILGIVHQLYQPFHLTLSCFEFVVKIIVIIFK